MTLQLSLPTEKGRAGKPRLNPYTRLLSRFYEPFFLLHSLNNTRAAHLPYPISGSLKQEQRRVFMRSLAFICDGRKGGQSFTAFAVAEVEGEDFPDEGEFVFLVSSKKATKCKLMLERSLTALLQYTTAKQEKMAELQRGFLDRCVDCKPTVHSEVEVLEHFYRYNLKFLDNDRYVYSSKPACFACKLYFTHHPAKMVVPESHEKVYLNWGPPMIRGFCKGDPASDLQRDLMNKITQAVRDEALGQVLGRNQPLGWHADSTTGLDTLPPLQNGVQGDISTHSKQQYTVFEADDSGFESGSVQDLLDAIEQKKGKKDEVESAGPVTADVFDVLKGILDGVLREDIARDTGSNYQETDDDEGGALLWVTNSLEKVIVGIDE
ncbi:hypothetical protein PWT90_02016 [Aphanocladium album]|nr:hypothetical protein PWT90_02016 [Aphanocladium album]